MTLPDFFFSAPSRTDVKNWLLIGWMKGDFLLDNPKRRDDHVNSISPAAGVLYVKT